MWVADAFLKAYSYNAPQQAREINPQVVVRLILSLFRLTSNQVSKKRAACSSVSSAIFGTKSARRPQQATTRIVEALRDAAT